MTKHDYIGALADELGFMTDAEREDVVREFDSHLSDAREARPDLGEEELIARLPPPASIAATFLAEFPLQDGAERAGAGSRERAREYARGHDDPSDAAGTEARYRDFFRYARRDEAELHGEAEGVERVEIIGPACDIKARPGALFSYAIRGRWEEEDKPAVSQKGGLWRVECGPDAEWLELTLPEGLAEFMATGASGDMDLILPAGANAALRSASGDLSLRCDGGSMSLSSASGDLSLEGRAGDAQLRSASGDIELSLRGACAALAASTKSGDIQARVEDGSADIKLQSMSGDLSLRLPEGSRHAVEAETLSGDLRSSRGTVRRGVVGAKLSYGDGPARAYAKTLSGDISIA